MASEETSTALPECGDSIDPVAFEQILDMDDEEDDREFSRGIVFGFFEQAETTFANMDTALEKKDLEQLSQLGHFLKGSSATLGLNLIRNSCEKIQHLGHRKDETGTRDETENFCLESIKTEVGKLREEYKRVEAALKRFYGDPPSET